MVPIRIIQLQNLSLYSETDPKYICAVKYISCQQIFILEMSLQSSQCFAILYFCVRSNCCTIRYSPDEYLYLQRLSSRFQSRLGLDFIINTIYQSDRERKLSLSICVSGLSFFIVVPIVQKYLMLYSAKAQYDYWEQLKPLGTVKTLSS